MNECRGIESPSRNVCMNVGELSCRVLQGIELPSVIGN